MFLSFSFSQYTRLTDARQTDGLKDISLMAKTALHRCSAVKNFSLSNTV